jgi:hypothetical protein
LKGLGSLLGRFGYGPEVTDTITRGYTVGPTPSVIVHNTFGSIHVVTGDDASVALTATRHARGITSDARQSDLDVIAITCTQDGNTVRIDAKVTEPTVALARQLWAELRITVPAATTLDLKAEAGNVEVASVRGALTARVDAGNLELKGTGGRTVAQVSAGNLEAGDVELGDGSRITVAAGQVVIRGTLARGANVDVRVDAGRARLTLPASTATHLDAFTDVGAITITGWSVPVTRNVIAATASGDLGTPPLGRLTVRVNIGDITLSATS